MDVKKAGRKVLAFLCAIIFYFVIHEGAHLIFALGTRTFESIHFMLFGMQIQADTSSMTDLQLGLFCMVGVLSTLTAGYVLCLSAKKIGRTRSNFFRALCYYVTIVFLFTDPVYLSLLCDFFGGGDMNGISLIIPEVAFRISLAVLAAANLLILIKWILPIYKQAFLQHNKTEAEKI